MTSIVEQPRDSPDVGELTKGEVKLPDETLAAFGGDELRARVFYEKYALRDADGRQTEKRPSDLWHRVARELASPEEGEEQRKEWAAKFYWLLENYRFVPGGRILFGAGQTRKSTLLNCLDGDTEVLIKETIETTRQELGYNNRLVAETKLQCESVTKARVRDIVGKEVLVLTQQGWKPVVFRSYGNQEVFRVVLRNGDEFVATGNHEWPIFYRTRQRPSKTTTANLKGKKLFITLPPRPEKNQEFRDGIVHGIVYGDGQRNSAATTYAVYLFGAQTNLIPYLKDYGTVTRYAGDNPSWGGAVFVGGIRSSYDLKELPPTNLSASYWYGFILGLIATDGHCTSKGQVGIDQADLDDLRVVREQVVRVGMYPNKVFKSREKSPFTGEDAPLYRFNISKFSMQESDLLRLDHRRKFAGRRVTEKVGNHTEVKDVLPLHEAREVYCCTEPVTHTFTIGNGILTGNCYFFKIREDSIEAIFDWCKEAARTYSFGGGVGTDISGLRPKGAPVNNSAIYSSGSVSFMELLSTTTGTIGQAGRRGALMITIRADHPDVMDFIDVKRDLKKVNYANISVKITDDFMSAVETDGDFQLHFKNDKVEVNRTVRAMDVWKSLVKGAWQSAEPGVLFWDSIKRDSTTEYNGMEVQGVNPCSEQTLEDFGCCCLGSVNLSAFVREPFTERASIDDDSLNRALQYGVRFLDNVLDYNAEKHPLPQQKQASLWSRRIGVGITGLGDMLIKLGLKYDEDSTIEFVDHLFERVKNVIYDYSTELAKEKGSFPAFDAGKHLAQPFISRLDEKVKEKIRTQGIRNAAVTTIPPVGSGSILAGTSSGVEPVFALFYTRRSKSLSEGEFKVFHPLVKEYMAATGAKSEEQFPTYFVTAHQIKPEMRVKMQAAIQKHIDTAISSCLTEDSMILTSEGPRILGDLVNRDSSIGFHGHNLAVVNGEGEMRGSDSYFVNGTQRVKSVRVFGNRTISGTPNHRVRVLDLNYNIVWKRLDELTTNDWVVGRVGLDAWGSNDRSITSIIGRRFVHERRTNSKEIALPVRPTRELGRLLGYIVADGGINENGVSISMRDDDSCFDDCVELPKRVFGLEPRIRPDNRSPHLQEITMNSRELVAWLGYVGLQGDCYTKQVPKVVLGAGRETVKEFLRGVTHDGYVSNSSINVVGVTNRRLATQIMYLLDNFGIVSTLQVEEKEGQHRIWSGRATSYVLQDVYRVAVCGHEAVRYADVIGFAQEERQEKAETIFGHRDDRIVPYGSIPDYGLRKEFRRQVLPRIKNLRLYRHFHSLTSNRKGRPTIDRDTVLAMIDLGLQAPRYLADPTYVFQRVEEISEDGMAPTFDLSVPEGNNYIANGVICHNTVNLPEDITPEEVEKIYLLAWKMGCFRKGNDVYTKDGLKDISEIVAGDMVLSHDGRYHKVTETYHLPAEVRRFVRLDLQGMEDLVATAEHPVLVLRPTARYWQKRAWANLENQLMWLKIGDVQAGDHVLQPKFRFENERIEELQVSNLVDCLVRDGRAYPYRNLPWKPSRKVIAARSNGIPDVVQIDEDFVWFIGWFIAEGHFQGESYVRVTLNPAETEIADRLEKVVYQKFGLRARRENVRSGGVSLRLQWGSRIFSRFLEQQVGRGARNKHLPNWFTRTSPELLETMVKAWSAGDGDGTTNGGVTTSKRLWREVFMAQSQLAHLTMRVSQSKSGLYRITEGAGHYVGKQWNEFLCYRVRRKFEFLDSEPVYNFAVEGADSYVVNGATVHNCKGITVYREGSREGILETEKVAKKVEAPKTPAAFERPKVMEGRTLKLRLPQGSIYLTANLVDGEIKEVFVTLGKSGADENADAAALGRLISLYLQHGGDIKNVIGTLKGIKGKYVSWDEGTQLQSIPDAIAKALELLTLNHVVKESNEPQGPAGQRQGATCPDCHEPSLIFESGCYKCTSCGYSKCE